MEKCPFCGEPVIRETVQGFSFRCGTIGPDIDGEYSTGHVCDITTYTRLLAEKDARINTLEREVEALRFQKDQLEAELDGPGLRT